MKKINQIIQEEIDNQINEAIDVYHGTDAFFHEFNLNKIGSGSGKSLGGWGIYFSTDPNVSKQYITTKSKVKKFGLKNGNFFDLDDYLSSGTGMIILDGLQNTSNVNDDDIVEFKDDFVNYSDDTSNRQALEWLNYVMGGEKYASMFLKKIGFDGNVFKDKTNPDATNYVVYNTDIIEYPDDNDDDLLNENFSSFIKKIKMLIDHGELTDEHIEKILKSNKFSPKQKETIQALINYNIDEETGDQNVFQRKQLKDFFNNHKLFSEAGSNEEADLMNVIDKNPQQKFVIYSAKTISSATSKSNAIATAKENGYENNKKFIFFEKGDNEMIIAYVITLL